MRLVPMMSFPLLPCQWCLVSASCSSAEPEGFFPDRQTGRDFPSGLFLFLCCGYAGEFPGTDLLKGCLALSADRTAKAAPHMGPWHANAYMRLGFTVNRIIHIAAYGTLVPPHIALHQISLPHRQYARPEVALCAKMPPAKNRRHSYHIFMFTWLQ